LAIVTVGEYLLGLLNSTYEQSMIQKTTLHSDCLATSEDVPCRSNRFPSPKGKFDEALTSVLMTKHSAPVPSDIKTDFQPCPWTCHRPH
jgi:hypothetical protein